MWSSSCTCFEYTLVAYKHTYFVQRNRMKCGHGRDLFYVSRRCFFVLFTHFFNAPWNTRWSYFYSTFENYLWHINTLILHNGIEWNVVMVGIYFCLEAFSFLFDIWKLLVAYKHTYFVQRNRMKCGHGRDLFYVSRSCFSFYLHTFLTHLNKWNTRWDLHFYSTFENYLWHINTLILCNGIEWNVVMVGIYFTCLEAVFHFIYTLFCT